MVFYGYIVTAAAFGVSLIGWGSYQTFGVFFKPMLTEFGWTRAEMSLAYSLALIVLGILGIIMGWLTDSLGPRIVVIVFGSFLGISYLLMSQINTLWQFQLYYGLVGAIGLSALTIPTMATVARWFVRKRGLMIGIAQAGSGIGGLIFAPFAGWLILSYGWRSAYTIFGVIIIVGIIVSGAFLRRDPKDAAQSPYGANEVVAPQRKKQSPSLPSIGLSLRQAIRTSRFWMVAVLFACFGFTRSTFIAHIAPHVQDLGFLLSDAANVLAALSLSSIIGRIIMGRVADIIGNGPTLVISFTATAMILLWGLVAENLWGLYLFALVFGFAWGAQAVLRFAITSESFGSVSLGLLMGTLVLAENGAAAFGSYFGGYIFDVFGNYNLVFWIGIGVAILGVILSWLLKRRPSEGATGESVWPSNGADTHMP